MSEHDRVDTTPRDSGSGFRHHVLFWLKEPDNEQHRRQFLRELRGMTKIEIIEEYSIGVPAGTPRDVVDNSWTFDWLLTFRDRDAWAVYNDHPLHLEFIERAAHLWERVQIYDSVPAE